jgi:multiple sugar transport system substrate-binding protein
MTAVTPGPVHSNEPIGGNIVRRRLAAMAAAVAIAALGAGCTTTGGSTQPQVTTGPADLTFWNTGGEEEGQVMQAVADLYKQSHPQVTIKVTAVPWEEGHAKVLAAATSRTGPDIISGGLSWGIEFGELGGMIDLRQYGIDTIKNQVQPGQWASIVSTGGAVYGLPMDMTNYVFYYRTDLLQKAGVSGPPKTWDELTAAIDKLRTSGIKNPFALDWGTLGWLNYFNFLKQAGGSLYSPDCKSVAINSPQAETALTFWADLHRKYGAPNAAPDVPAGLANGTIAMAYSGGRPLRCRRAPPVRVRSSAAASSASCRTRSSPPRPRTSSSSSTRIPRSRRCRRPPRRRPCCGSRRAPT